MTKGIDPGTPPQDTGLPDAVERDPAALNSAEDLDEDRLRLDPLEEGIDPPEHWAQADKYGNTPYEQSHRNDLDRRLREEQPDVSPDDVEEDPVEVLEGDLAISVEPLPGDDQQPGTRAAERGQSADEAGGSIAEELRTPRSE